MTVFRCEECGAKYDDIYGEHKCPEPVPAPKVVKKVKREEEKKEEE